MDIDEAYDMLRILRLHYWSALNEWERQFVPSLQEQLRAEQDLTPRQREVLDKIFGRVTEGGTRGSSAQTRAPEGLDFNLDEE